MTDTVDSALIAQYLADNPHFFEEHAALLGQIKLSSPLTGRAVSLQERQMEVMRDKYKALELHMAELIRTANENAAIATKFQAWTAALLRARLAADLPAVLVEQLASQFHVPQVGLRLWDLGPDHQDAWYTQDVSEDARLFAASLATPYCGPNKEFEALRWLADAAAVQSTAILPLRDAAGARPFGLLLLGSPDAQRFTAQMGTDFLLHIADTAAAALGALRG
ncbi:DUF484 family protein [Massilia sp. TS11]|uniref:DUF484 family protein n=1 Tax=Massilia sp. TS11 TaxID=2908003 RepID=UPI001EDB0DC6|nr:DUF484 family protein [Massilia sp. TS11]MCG2585877.1 DUF484 family protein [Massilia sp. TS11]